MSRVADVLAADIHLVTPVESREEANQDREGLCLLFHRRDILHLEGMLRLGTLSAVDKDYRSIMGVDR